MGPALSVDEQQVRYDSYANALLTSNHWQGFAPDSSLQRFSGLDSTQQLNNYRDHVLYSDGLQYSASIVQKLGSGLGGFTPVPHAVGLVALVISMILEGVGKSLDKPTMGTGQILERVFAQEKSREVRDLMDEYLKQLRFNLRNPRAQLTATMKKEDSLSLQLTRLKNSMIDDGHMSTPALRQWVNGAAFHVQMLIHQARLLQTAPIKALLAADVYQNQLNLLMGKYKDFLPTVISTYRQKATGCYSTACRTISTHYCEVWHTESNISPIPRVMDIQIGSSCATGSKVAEAMFTKPQITWAYTYFSNLKADIPILWRQKNPFNI